MTTLNRNLVRKADCYIDEQHEVFSKLGQQFFNAFGYDQRNNRVSTQVRNLQQNACSARCFADIEDFVKNQMGKEIGKGTDQWSSVGSEVLKQLRTLRKESEKAEGESAQQFLLRLHLARGWVRAVVSEYLYQVACAQIGKDS